MIALGRRREIFLGGRLAGQHLDRAVVVRRHLVVQRADQRNAMAQLGLQRKDFADVEPRHGGVDRTQRPAIFAGRVGLAVVGFELAGPAPHPKQNDRGVGDGVWRPLAARAASRSGRASPPRASVPTRKNSRRCIGPAQAIGRHGASPPGSGDALTSDRIVTDNQCTRVDARSEACEPDVEPLGRTARASRADEVPPEWINDARPSQHHDQHDHQYSCLGHQNEQPAGHGDQAGQGIEPHAKRQAHVGSRRVQQVQAEDLAQELHEDPHDHGGLDHRLPSGKKQNTAVSAPSDSSATIG